MMKCARSNLWQAFKLFICSRVKCKEKIIMWTRFYLYISGWKVCVCTFIKLTLRFKRSLSLSVSVSALAMTGTMLTLLWMAFINSTSRGFRLGENKEQGGQMGRNNQWRQKTQNILRLKKKKKRIATSFSVKHTVKLKSKLQHWGKKKKNWT